MNLGKMIFELRKAKNVTQEEMAAELGVTAAAVSKWENGYTLPDVMMLCAIADYFQVTTDDLLCSESKYPNTAKTAQGRLLHAQLLDFAKQHGVPQEILGVIEKKLQE